MLDTKFAGSRGANQRQPEHPPSTSEGELLFSQELVIALMRYWWVLVLGPLMVALLAYLIAAMLPPRYISTAFLRIDRSMGRTLEALMTSPGEADKVLSRFPDTGSSAEARSRYLHENMWLTDLDPQGERQAARLFRMDVAHRNPENAQAINSQLIDAWLETTKPPPRERANLEAELERNKVAVASNTAHIQQLKKDPTTLVAPNSMAGEIATPISGLMAKRDQSLAAIAGLQNRLAGLGRDVVATPPHLPREPSLPKKQAIATLAGLASIPFFLIVVLLGRRFASGRSPLDVLARPFTRRSA
jgi:hypothetical protein